MHSEIHGLQSTNPTVGWDALAGPNREDTSLYRKHMESAVTGQTGDALCPEDATPPYRSKRAAHDLAKPRVWTDSTRVVSIRSHQCTTSK